MYGMCTRTFINSRAPTLRSRSLRLMHLFYIFVAAVHYYTLVALYPGIYPFDFVFSQYSHENERDFTGGAQEEEKTVYHTICASGPIQYCCTM
ncbi:hypothetical protein B0H12DRAFT_1136194 [Mycena haematopus]|nr:hypothetical protein B0H12DRAFT_1136194 [Mycena haematopus]